MKCPERVIHLGEALTSIKYGDERTEYVRGDLYDEMEKNRNLWREKCKNAQYEVLLLRSKLEAQR